MTTKGNELRDSGSLRYGSPDDRGVLFMQALLLTEYRKLELTSLDRPTVGPHDVLVRVAACGICGSDVHGYDGSTGRRIPPLVMGHEAAGVVAEVGAKCRAFASGDRVTFDSTISCGECDLCRCGQVNLCANRRVLGVSCGDYRQQGAFAEFVVVPSSDLIRCRDDLPFEHAALVEPVSVAVHAVGRLRIDGRSRGRRWQRHDRPVGDPGARDRRLRRGDRHRLGRRPAETGGRTRRDGDD